MFGTNHNEKKSEQLVYDMVRTSSNLSRSRSSRRRVDSVNQRAKEYSNIQVKEGLEMIVKLVF
jgi:hypothetical protein